eukprot:scaffold1033_cov408-Prasinococcus_capsulatus_cf.AAC.17
MYSAWSGMQVLADVLDDSANDGIIGKWGAQLAGIGMTLVVSISSGLFTAFILKFLREDVQVADDSPYWEVAEEAKED